MSESIQELRSLSDEELITRHDIQASNTTVGANHYLAELARRDQDRQTSAMLAYTNQIRWMTTIVTGATLINLAVAVILIFR